MGSGGVGPEGSGWGRRDKGWVGPVGGPEEVGSEGGSFLLGMGRSRRRRRSRCSTSAYGMLYQIGSGMLITHTFQSQTRGVRMERCHHGIRDGIGG